ncbi:MAG: AI-2E family transporter [Campylobacteraceae bacterium]|jgi:predicted PurR-regulated permease PerM|nr:AI-2E family transporter [Campylobacteraceae bacterium]
MNANNNRFFILAVFLLTLYGMVKLYSPFLLDITIASLLAVAMNSINVFIQRFVKIPMLSAILTTLVLLLLFFAPIGYAATTLTNSLIHVNDDLVEKAMTFLSNIKLSLPQSLSFLELDVDGYFANLDKAAITAKAVSYATFIGKMSAGFLKDMVLIIIFFFFATYYGKNLNIYFKSVIPINPEESDGILSEVANVMSVVFYSIILTAILEGVLFAFIGIAYGYNGLMLGILYGFASLIPIVGGMLVWLPLSLIEFSNGNTTSALVISIYSFVGIGAVDNFVKPLIIKYVNKMLLKTPVYFNTLLIFFSIIAGLASFGFWGMILGPAITTFFISLLKLFRIIKEKSPQKQNPTPPPIIPQ